MRGELLALHKVLLEHQKAAYESTHGKALNPNEYYQLVVNDSAFAWLRTLSALVVSIDELLEDIDALSEEKFSQVAAYTKKLLTGGGVDEVFSRDYAAAVQESAQVAGHHAAVMAFL